MFVRAAGGRGAQPRMDALRCQSVGKGVPSARDGGHHGGGCGLFLPLGDGGFRSARIAPPPISRARRANAMLEPAFPADLPVPGLLRALLRDEPTLLHEQARRFDAWRAHGAEHAP